MFSPSLSTEQGFCYRRYVERLLRCECAVRRNRPDGRSEALTRRLARQVSGVRAALVDVYLVDPGFSPEEAAGVLADPVTTEVFCEKPARMALMPDWTHAVEITVKPGVTDPVAATVDSVLAPLKPDSAPVRAETARQIVLHAPTLTYQQVSALCAELYNPLIQYASLLVRNTDAAFTGSTGLTAGNTADATDAGGTAGDLIPLVEHFPDSYPRAGSDIPARIEQIDVAAMDDATLIALNDDRLLALNPDELAAIRAFYSRPDVIEARERLGLTGATDVELEMFGQTWSEHCKHKIFAARITLEPPSDYTTTTSDAEPTVIENLFKRCIASVTETLAAGRIDLLSVFHDNSGVVVFDDEYAACFKAETHNSPSALDPYGGAITGIVGVNRDILGTGRGARPIFNTNALCFADPSCPDSEVPAPLLPPRRVLEGVHEGIVDGGNQSGIPVVAGAFLFDDSYLGKPLVFCGTGGLLPREVAGRPGWEKRARAGDIAVMIGGRIGKDGIHGATFSSLALDESSPTSAVQIGDPITQKKMIDFLLEARDEGLLQSLTDNGAGGLSSSLGEMAEESGGIEVDLDRCPVKYDGLTPWEIWVSESQERMSAAVAPDDMKRFLELAALHDVEATAIGTFTDDGTIVLRWEGRTAGFLDLAFLHDGLPTMELRAQWIPPQRRGPRPAEHAGPASRGNEKGPDAPPAGDFRIPARSPRAPEQVAPPPLRDQLLTLLRDPNIASKEALIRRYDHEVQAGTVGKPFVGPAADGPSDGGIVRPRRNSSRGLTVTHGICPRYGDWDSYRMAVCAVDEAFRAHIGLGGDPARAWVLDNFCWPDPVESEKTPDGAFKLASLVRAARGLADACLSYRLPIISGKDSMKNDARSGERTISVRPTLLVSLLGIVENVAASLSSDFADPGDAVYLLGRSRGELGGSSWDRCFGAPWEPSPLPDLAESRELYRTFASCVQEGLVTSAHDLSDGGLAAALAESAVGGRTGVSVDISTLSLDPVLESPEITSGEPVDTPVYAKSPALESQRDGTHPASSHQPPDRRTRLLFGESAGRLLVSVTPASCSEFEAAFSHLPCTRIGTVEDYARMRIVDGDSCVLEVTTEELVAAWHDFDRRTEAGHREEG